MSVKQQVYTMQDQEEKITKKMRKSNLCQHTGPKQKLPQIPDRETACQPFSGQQTCKANETTSPFPSSSWPVSGRTAEVAAAKAMEIDLVTNYFAVVVAMIHNLRNANPDPMSLHSLCLLLPIFRLTSHCPFLLSV